MRYVRRMLKTDFLPVAFAVLVLSALLTVPDLSAATNRIKVSFSDKNGRSLCAFQAELAMTPEEQSLGLMFRQSLDADKGMLFIFEGDEPRSFWMKNTYIPLDLIFINSRNEVVGVHYSAIPKDETNILSGSPAQYVLEVRAGRAKTCAIGKGAKMKIGGAR
jgi:uncharacterized membrane protein (UPF0127 family)